VVDASLSLVLMEEGCWTSEQAELTVYKSSKPDRKAGVGFWVVGCRMIAGGSIGDFRHGGSFVLVGSWS